MFFVNAARQVGWKNGNLSTVVTFLVVAAGVSLVLLVVATGVGSVLLVVAAGVGSVLLVVAAGDGSVLLVVAAGVGSVLLVVAAGDGSVLSGVLISMSTFDNSFLSSSSKVITNSYLVFGYNVEISIWGTSFLGLKL